MVEKEDQCAARSTAFFVVVILQVINLIIKQSSLHTHSKLFVLIITYGGRKKIQINGKFQTNHLRIIVLNDVTGVTKMHGPLELLIEGFWLNA